MAFGRTASGPERATADLLVEGIGAVVETGDWYSDIDLIERFDEPPVSMDDMVREFSESGYVQDYLPRRASVHYLIDDGMFQRIHHLAMPTTVDEFVAQTCGMPRSTEVERKVIQRLGQGIFRRDLLNYWGDRCAITGLAVEQLLRASHAKPWVCCENDSDRLNHFNGLLLAADLDAAFENGFIGVAEDGTLLVSQRLDCQDPNARRLLNLDGFGRIERLQAGHIPWFSWHRMNKFDRD